MYPFIEKVLINLGIWLARRTQVGCKSAEIIQRKLHPGINDIGMKSLPNCRNKLFSKTMISQAVTDVLDLLETTREMTGQHTDTKRVNKILKELVDNPKLYDLLLLRAILTSSHMDRYAKSHISFLRVSRVKNVEEIMKKVKLSIKNSSESERLSIMRRVLYETINQDWMQTYIEMKVSNESFSQYIVRLKIANRLESDTSSITYDGLLTLKPKLRWWKAYYKTSKMLRRNKHFILLKPLKAGAIYGLTAGRQIRFMLAKVLMLTGSTNI